MKYETVLSKIFLEKNVHIVVYLSILNSKAILYSYFIVIIESLLV